MLFITVRLYLIFLFFCNFILYTLYYGSTFFRGRIEIVFIISLWGCSCIPGTVLCNDLILLFILFELGIVLLIAPIGIHFVLNNYKKLFTTAIFFLFGLVASAIYLFGCGWLLFIAPKIGPFTLHYNVLIRFELVSLHTFVTIYLPNVVYWTALYIKLCVALLIAPFIYKLLFAPHSQ
jgi:hypothetical protein